MGVNPWQTHLTFLLITNPPSPRLNRIIFLLSWFLDQFFLTGFVFVYRDDLQIVASRFQNKRFVHFAR
jgi:hypothetical protein